MFLKFKPYLTFIKTTECFDYHNESTDTTPSSHFEQRQSVLRDKGTIYIKDNFYEVGVRATFINGNLRVFLKHKSSGSRALSP